MPTEPASQRRAFLDREGDAYFERNREAHLDLDSAAARDPLMRAYRELGLRPRAALEVGASDGWRLACLRRDLGAEARLVGVDPSAEAVRTGRELHPEVQLEVGTADELPFEDGSMDLVTFGFCLYLCDRADLFRIAAEADRVLADGGHIAIYDFHTERPYRNTYGPQAGLSSYKYDTRRLFNWNPAYVERHHAVFPHPLADGSEPTSWSDDDLVAVNVLQKSLGAAWPSREQR